MKIFNFLYESTGKTGKKIVDLFSISFLVPKISALKEVQNGTKIGPIVETLAKTAKFVTSTGLHLNK